MLGWWERPFVLTDLMKLKVSLVITIYFIYSVCCLYYILYVIACNRSLCGIKTSSF